MKESSQEMGNSTGTSNSNTTFIISQEKIEGKLQISDLGTNTMSREHLIIWLGSFVFDIYD